MNVRQTPARYHPLSIALHWTMLVLFVAVYASMELRGFFAKGTAPREAMKNLHFMLGLLVFTLTWLRLALRALQPAPAILPTLPRWQAQASSLMHLALYALKIAMPLLGWLTLSAAGKPVPFFGLTLPALIGPDKALAGQFKEVHEAIATLGYFLIGGHAVAGLYHHYIQRDNTLVRMLPRRG